MARGIAAIAEKLLDHADRIGTRIGLSRAQYYTVIGYVIGGCVGTVGFGIASYFFQFDAFDGLLYGGTVGGVLGSVIGLSSIVIRYISINDDYSHYFSFVSRDADQSENSDE